MAVKKEVAASNVSDDKGVRGQGGGPTKKTPVKVSQSTIDSMKQMGMSKAISKANSGDASAEFIEGAKRMYGTRVKDNTPIKSSPSVTKSATMDGPKGKVGPVVAERNRMEAAGELKHPLETHGKQNGKRGEDAGTHPLSQPQKRQWT